jgi:hypothetical protein
MIVCKALFSTFHIPRGSFYHYCEIGQLMDGPHEIVFLARGSEREIEAYRPGNNNRDVLSKMLRQSKNTLRGNALFRELSTAEKATRPGKEACLPALPNMIDDYHSGKH